ncbi:MAG TPA: histidine kinase [Gemmatimonadales bacterium]
MTRPPWIATLAVAGICVLLGVISVIEIHHMSLTHGMRVASSVVFGSTMPRWMFLGATLPLVLWLAHWKGLRPVRAHVVLMHLALFLLISVGHAAMVTWTMGGSTPMAQLFPLMARLTRAWYGGIPVMVATYVGVLAVAWAIQESREREQRAIRESQLEALLQAARLDALRAKLQPHFLYNTLHGIAALVADRKVDRAVTAIEQLSELLHASLREDGSDIVTVREEVALAEQYLGLQQMRFGDRLRYEVTVAPAVAEGLVPVLVLQPIVENAVVHGLDGQEQLHVGITAAAVPRGLCLTVQNDGPTPDPSATRPDGRGLGLAATRARLTTAYGDKASLTLLPRGGGGVMVQVIVPNGSA